MSNNYVAAFIIERAMYSPFTGRNFRLYPSQRFVQLALALDRHIPGYVDAYFGPPEWKEQSIARGPRPITELSSRSRGFSDRH